MSGLLSHAKLIVYMKDGTEYEMVPTPLDIKQVQLHFRGQDPVEMEQTLFTSWKVLNNAGVVSDDFETFERQVKDYGVPGNGDGQEVDDPKA